MLFDAVMGTDDTDIDTWTPIGLAALGVLSKIQSRPHPVSSCGQVAESALNDTDSALALGVIHFAFEHPRRLRDRRS